MTPRKRKPASKPRELIVWVGVDSLGEIHLDTIAGEKEACDNSHSLCEGDIQLHTTRAVLRLDAPRRPSKITTGLKAAIAHASGKRLGKTTKITVRRTK